MNSFRSNNISGSANKEEIDFSGDEGELRRKPIGWNYQNAFATLKRNENFDNGLKSPSDDIEIVEVLEVKKDKNNSSCRKSAKSFPIHAFPPSSSRQEIKKIIRGTSQSSITKFLSPIKKKESGEKILTNKNEPGKKGLKDDATVITKDIKINGKSQEKASKEHIAHQADTSTNLSLPSISNGGVTITLEYSKNLIDKFVEKWKSLLYFSKDQEKIKARLLKHYSLSHPTYLQSRTFVNAIEKGIENVTSKNVYIYIADIISNLKKYKDHPYIEKRKSLKSQSDDKVEVDVCEKEVLDEAELKKQRRLARIEKEMKKTINKIKEIEEAEVDMDEEENSSYILGDRYKKHLLKLDNYYCKLAECSTYAGRPVDKPFRYKGSRYPEINKRISAWVTKHNCFPDYPDVLNLVRAVTKKNNIPLRPEDIRYLGREIFTDVGKELQRRRMNDDLFCIYAYADPEIPDDPSNVDENLKKKLDENMEIAKEKLTETFQYYVDKQTESNEKAVNESKTTSANQSKNDEVKDTANVSNLSTSENTEINKENPSCKSDDDTNNSGVIIEQEVRESIKNELQFRRPSTDDLSESEDHDEISQITTESDGDTDTEGDQDSTDVEDSVDGTSNDTASSSSKNFLEVENKRIPVEVLSVTNEVDLASEDEEDNEIEEILEFLPSPVQDDSESDDELDEEQLVIESFSTYSASSSNTKKRPLASTSFKTAKARKGDFLPEIVELE